MTGVPRDSQSLVDILPLFESGDSERLSEFTRGIENRPNAVLAFERAFNALMDEGAIEWEGTPDQRAVLEMIAEWPSKRKRQLQSKAAIASQTSLNR